MNALQPSLVAGKNPVMGKTATPEERADWIEQGQRLYLFQLAEVLNGNECADLLEIGRQSWSKYVNGDQELPRRHARKLKDLFGCSLDWIYAGDATRNSDDFKPKLLWVLGHREEAEARLKAKRKPRSPSARSTSDRQSRARS
jgi:hypothetical protein